MCEICQNCVKASAIVYLHQPMPLKQETMTACAELLGDCATYTLTDVGYVVIC